MRLPEERTSATRVARMQLDGTFTTRSNIFTPTATLVRRDHGRDALLGKPSVSRATRRQALVRKGLSPSIATWTPAHNPKG